MKKSHVAMDVSKMVAFGTASLVRTLAQMSRVGETMSSTLEHL